MKEDAMHGWSRLPNDGSRIVSTNLRRSEEGNRQSRFSERRRQSPGEEIDSSGLTVARALRRQAAAGTNGLVAASAANAPPRVELEALPEPAVSVFERSWDGEVRGERPRGAVRSVSAASQTVASASAPSVRDIVREASWRPNVATVISRAAASNLEPLPEPLFSVFDLGIDGEPPLTMAQPSAALLEGAMRALTIVEAPTSMPCPVCLEVLPSQCARLPCGHCFHKDCVVPWLALRGTCPVCRACCRE